MWSAVAASARLRAIAGSRKGRHLRALEQAIIQLAAISRKAWRSLDKKSTIAEPEQQISVLAELVTGSRERLPLFLHAAEFNESCRARPPFLSCAQQICVPLPLIGAAVPT